MCTSPNCLLLEYVYFVTHTTCDNIRVINYQFILRFISVAIGNGVSVCVGSLQVSETVSSSFTTETKSKHLKQNFLSANLSRPQLTVFNAVSFLSVGFIQLARHFVRATLQWRATAVLYFSLQ